MLGCLESLSLIVGLVILIRGKFNLFSKRKLEGKYARIVGFILMLPGPVSLLIGYVFSSMIYVTTGDTELVTWMINERWPVLVFIDLPIFVGALVAAILVTWKTPEVLVTTPPLPAVLTVAEAASYLQMPEAEILQLIEQGDLTARRIGDEYCLNQEVLTKFVKKCGPISLREMIGSINPRARNVMIGAILGAITGFILPPVLGYGIGEEVIFSMTVFAFVGGGVGALGKNMALLFALFFIVHIALVFCSLLSN